VNAQRYDVTFESLLNEMTDRSVVTKKPVYPYKTLQSSSYNRASVSPSDPAGWFANNDQGYDLRKEVNHGRLESVLMECDGPGVLTRIWTPFFYKDFNNRKGPDILIYLDGDEEPSIRANFIELVTGKSFVSPPFAGYTCRAGDLYLPVSFGKSCKVSVEGDAYFYIINYRKYDRQVSVETFRPELMAKYKPLLEKAGRELKNPAPFTKGKKVSFAKTITNKQAETVTLPEGSAAIRNVEFKLSAADISRALRSTVLEMIFDDKTTVWCPLGDFFGNVNGIDPYRTWEREVKADGTMICRWIMPYKKQGLIRIHNLHESPVELSINAVVSPWKWTDDTYYFHACWTTEGPYMANPVRDMNFVEVEGEGIHVGDNFVVLNPLPWWWGEGDEKIYVDEDFDRNFPSHFGTGTEDYYGWAGGEHPSREDEFSSPFLANIRVGGETRGFTGERPHTRGYNICTRSRSLDAIPFAKHFKLDIEAFNFSSGPDAILQYALTSVWYGKGDAVHNRTPLVAEASAPVPQIEDLEKITRTSAFRRKGAIECEDLKIQSLSDNLAYEIETTKNDNDENKWSMNKQLLVRAKQNGAFLSFLLQEQYHPKKMILYMTSAPTYGKVNIYVNNRPVKAEWDGYSPVAKICEIDLGKQEPLNNTFEIKIEVTGKHGASSDYHFGLDCLLLQDN
jgi:hypothetical protein